ncbi:EXS family-domain-containing protein [Lineolata rhizophorae]|uniref:EXS family-domain-containing protein n=1 Tax=Lineolata rhizophorae TaxID=578093 RepID=A0A6A6NTZ2_9PEZI|nr:EXS family-domain-containing protein [Lineolata rhizophorae]
MEDESGNAAEGGLGIKEMDAFSLTFPLPFRVAFIIVLGVWGWGVNCHYLHIIGIDVPALIRYPLRPYPGSTDPPSPAHTSIYRHAYHLTTLLLSLLLVFLLFTHRSAPLVLSFSPLASLTLLAILVYLILPLPSHPGRARFFATLRRISIGGLAQAQDGKFGDILVADALTSYAKVLADLAVCVCAMLRRDGAGTAAAGGVGTGSTAPPERGCGAGWVVPLVTLLPSVIRFRQCLVEYVRVRRSLGGGGAGAAGQGWGGQHLANAAKYATALPVVVMGAALSDASRGDDGRVRKWGLEETGLFRAWLVAVAANSLYSFYWDVARDWDLSLLSAERGGAAQHPYGLRRHLRCGPPAVYYAVVALDLLLRCTWSVKLSPFLDEALGKGEGGLFVLEVAEVARRGSGGAGGPEDVLLGDFGKLDED